MRLFIADRDLLFRSLLRFLSTRACSVSVCRSDDGHDAYCKILEFKPHLLIVADELNTCSGLQLLNRLKGQMNPATITVLLSSVEDFSFPSKVADHVDRIIYRHDLCEKLPWLIGCAFNNVP